MIFLLSIFISFTHLFADSCSSAFKKSFMQEQMRYLDDVQESATLAFTSKYKTQELMMEDFHKANLIDRKVLNGSASKQSKILSLENMRENLAKVYQSRFSSTNFDQMSALQKEFAGY